VAERREPSGQRGPESVVHSMPDLRRLGLLDTGLPTPKTLPKSVGAQSACGMNSFGESFSVQLSFNPRLEGTEFSELEIQQVEDGEERVGRPPIPAPFLRRPTQ